MAPPRIRDLKTVPNWLWSWWMACPIALASSTQLNNNGENRHPCLVTDCSGNYSFFIIQYNVNCRLLVCNLCTMFKMFLFTPCSVENLFQEWMLNFEDICTTLVAVFPYPHTPHKKVICFIDFLLPALRTLREGKLFWNWICMSKEASFLRLSYSAGQRKWVQLFHFFRKLQWDSWSSSWKSVWCFLINKGK